ncbi:MAG: Flp pilus assembly protein CpaB [Schwartzia sp.]|nr:Flp pilus assembly protein CpaB [Schwartzia sp. (in: firmicutes)]
MKFDEKLSSLLQGLTPRQLLMAAAAAGLFTFALLYWGLSHLMGGGEKEKQAQEPAVKMAKVVQAKTDIKAREQIQESMLQLVETPENLVPAGAIREVKGLAGRPTRVAIMAGDVVTEKKLYPSVKESGFTGIIPADCRAVSVAVNDVTGVSGFMKPGDYVDVMFISEKLDNTRISGEVILQNVLLLGINSMADRPESQGQQGKDGDGKGKEKEQAAAGGKPATATLAVHPEEEIRLAVAAKAGQIYLALRPYKPQNKYMLETEYSYSKGRAAQTGTAPASAPAPAYTPPVTQSAPYAGSSDAGGQMEIIRGTKSSRGK